MLDFSVGVLEHPYIDPGQPGRDSAGRTAVLSSTGMRASFS